ncbi:MAG TPA: acyl-CoA thioesterase [Planctomycetales bacterium]|jgi:acyl-CoA thioester hydrolase|nr:acyl-CoA thioesterase [Planctomycetales bacterium]
MPDTLLAGYPVVVEQAVAWGEMDAYQHVNNVVYFRYFENSRLEYFRRLDWLAMQNDTGVGPILATTHARFRKPLTYPDAILIAARISEVGMDRLTMQHRIFSRRLGVVAAEGEGIIVTFDYARSVKAPVPDELRRRIAELEATANHAF